MQKQTVRKLIKEKKRQLNEPEIADYSRLITEKIISEDCYKEADAVLVFLSFNQEIRTEELIRQAWKDGKTVAVPKVLTGKQMDFICIDTFYNIEPGFCNIPEPSEGEIFKGKSALLVMPGLAFDKKGGRIGYGGGFYDRYIREHGETKFFKVAPAYEFQIFDTLETEDHDIPCDMVITACKTFRKVR